MSKPATVGSFFPIPPPSTSVPPKKTFKVYTKLRTPKNITVKYRCSTPQKSQKLHICALSTSKEISYWLELTWMLSCHKWSDSLRHSCWLDVTGSTNDRGILFLSPPSLPLSMRLSPGVMRPRARTRSCGRCRSRCCCNCCAEIIFCY